jgi:hypothetical protein
MLFLLVDMHCPKVPGILSGSSYLKCLYWVTRSCKFIASIRELMKWVMALRMSGLNKGATVAWKEDQPRGEAMRPNSRCYSICSRHLLIPVSYAWLGPITVGPCLWVFPTDWHKSNILHLERGRVPPFWQWISPTLSDFGGPLMLGSPVGLAWPLWI